MMGNAGKFFSRKEYHEAKAEEQEQLKIEKLRLIPIWLIMLLVVGGVIISIIIGLMVGYGVIGEGKMVDALKISTWKHLLDLALEGTE